LSPTEVQQLLKDLGLRPSRALGQNFLCDANVSRWIVDQLEPGPEDVVIEVGPGLGALTEHLVGRVRQLVLMEMDGRLAGRLRELYAGDEGVRVVEGDATQVDLRGYFAEQPVKLIGNLPYSAGGEIIRRFLRQPTPVSRAVLTLQKEVGRRLCAVPGTKSFGLLTLRVQSEWRVKQLKVLGPEVFLPRPAVESGVIRLEGREPGEMPPYSRALFDRLARQGFAQRRKQLKKLIPEAKERWPELMGALGTVETVRAEEMTLEQWIAFTNLLDDHPLKDLHQAGTAEDIFDVVDENDEVTGQEVRSKVHGEGLKHRAVHLFVFNRAGELYLQKRSSVKDVHPNCWDSSAAGHLDAAETYDAAAVRELEEELGISGEVEAVAKISPCADTGWEFVQLYRVMHEGKRLRLSAREIDYGGFFPVGVVDEWVKRRPEDFATGFIECWRVYGKRAEGSG
jgi:16S rRNA (adenine1518-N6/adenine1519-N6)-dimethyltransferase